MLVSTDEGPLKVLLGSMGCHDCTAGLRREADTKLIRELAQSTRCEDLCFQAVLAMPG